MMCSIQRPCRAAALTQALLRWHSSGASCPVLSLLTSTEASEPTKHLLCQILLTLAPSYLGKLSSKVRNYADATSEHAPADNRCLCP